MQVYQVNRIMVSEDPQPIHLTPQAEQLLRVLRNDGGWVNRTELAKLAGKSALNKWDLVLLDKLAHAGLIETKQIPRHGPIGYEWQYRVRQIDEREAHS